jgi:hypothetical protein
MVDVLAALIGQSKTEPEKRFLWSPWDDLSGTFSYNGHPYFGYPIQSLTGDRETIKGGFEGYVRGAYESSGIVAAVELIRLSVFSEARFMYRRLIRGRPGELHSTASLNILHRPSPGKTTGDLLARAILDVDMAGNHFAVRIGGKIKRLRPDWVTIVLGSENDDIDPNEDPDAEVAGYLYHPGGNMSRDPITYEASEVVHWPGLLPDPLANYRGMSWLTPVVREILADRQATGHKQKFFENGATPNMIVKHQISDPDVFEKWIALFKDSHEGVRNAYKTLHLGAGADATVVGRDMQQLDFKAVQGAGETRIAAASGVGAVMAQFSEGMEGSALNAGNYSAARRRVADGLFRPLWRSICSAYEPIVAVPRNSELWYDERDIAFLREDEKDAADIQNTRAGSIRALLDAGYEADSVTSAIENDDFTLLKHTGLFSVQLQPPGTTEPEPDPAPDIEDPSDD